MNIITKKAIANALREILKEKSLSHVTVKEISERCHINRQTFYYHFLDIPDLVEWSCLYNFNEKIEYTKNDWKENVYSVFTLLKEDQDFIMNIYHSASQETLERSLNRISEPYFSEYILNIAKDYDIKKEDVDFVINFYRSALVAFLLNWIANYMKEDPKILIDKLYILINGTIENALKVYSNEKIS